MEEKLRDILPKYYKYKIINLQLGKLDENNFDAIFKVNLFDEVDVKNWLEQFELSSLTNFRVARTAPAKKSRVLFKKYYRCHHNTRAGESASKTKKAHVKHTGCEATLLITVNNAHMKNCKQVDVKRYPCTVKYHNYHNHPLTSDELLCHRKPSQEIEQKIRELLLKNHTPVSALKILKQDLQQEFKDEYSKIVKDGAFCPKLQWVYHQYYSIFKDTCPYKVKYFPTEFLIEESIDGNSDAEMGTEVVQVEHSRPSSPANSHLTSEDFDDITYEEFILSPEDNSLLESHFVEVYTMDDNKMIKEENDIFISENDIADLQVMEEVVPAIDDETSSDHVNAVTNEEIINVIKNEPLANEPCSTLWNSEDIEQKDTELNDDDLNDIFGEACHDLNGDIFLPRMNKYKNKIDTSDEDET